MEHVLEDLLLRYGLFAVFLGGATEGDLTLILTGALAHLGYFGFVPATAVGCLGAVCIDSFWYMLGRTRADRIRGSRFYQQAGPWVEMMAERVGPWEILFARFIFGARIPSMIFWGTRKVPFDRFLALDIVGCTAWGFVLSALGYAFSNSVALLLDKLKRTERHVVIVVAVIVLVLLLRPLGRRLVQRRAGGASGYHGTTSP